MAQGTIKSVDFDAIAASVALDSTAGRVTARGDHWEPRKPRPESISHWDAPPPMRSFVTPNGGANVDLTGTRFGRFTVVGLLAEAGGKNRGDRWVVRCACGDYEVRSPKAIRLILAGFGELERNPMAGRCYDCMQLEKIKNDYRKKGSASLSTFINPTARQETEKRKSPQAILAEESGKFADCQDDESRLRAAIEVISKLNSAGYRIVSLRREVADDRCAD